MTNPLDPGPEVRAVWTEDSEMRRARAHFPGHTHVDHKQWGDRAIELFGTSDACSEDTVLEWGCGGGAVTTAWYRTWTPDVYHGVDVSRDALEITRDLTAASRAPYGGRFEMHEPSETSAIASASIDCIVSTAVFMHFPSFEYARAVLREMRRVAAPGSRGLIQTRYYQPGDHYDPAALQPLSYAVAFKRFCAWQVADFWRELEQAGFTPRDVVIEQETQNAWYRFGG